MMRADPAKHQQEASKARNKTRWQSKLIMDRSLQQYRARAVDALYIQVA